MSNVPWPTFLELASLSGKALEDGLERISVRQHPIAARFIASSSKSNEELVKTLSTFSNNLVNLQGSPEELGVRLLYHVWKQLCFCRRYGVLKMASSILMIDTLKHLRGVRERCKARASPDLGVSSVGPDGGVLKVSLLLLKVVLGGEHHSPKLFLNHVQELFDFLQWADNVDAESGKELSGILYLSRHIHGDVLHHVDGFDALFESSAALERLRSPDAAALQKEARRLSWATIDTDYENSVNMFEPPSWPTGIFGMETGIDVQIHSVASCVGVPVKASVREKEPGTPSQLKGYLVNRKAAKSSFAKSVEAFPFEIMGRVKMHQSKEEVKEKKKTEYEQWACPACTYRNKGGAETCQTCGTKSPPRTKLAQKGRNPHAFHAWIQKDGKTLLGWFGNASKKEQRWVGKVVQIERKKIDFFVSKDIDRKQTYSIVDFPTCHSSGGTGQTVALVAEDTLHFSDGDPFTLQCSIMYDSAKASNGQDQALVSNGVYEIGVSGDHQLYARYGPDTIAAEANALGSDKHLWHQVTFTCNGATLSLYVDGQLVGGGAGSSNPNQSCVPSQFTIGSKLGPGKILTNAYRGLVCGVRVWKLALTSAQVFGMASGKINAASMNGVNGVMLAHWPLLDDGTRASFLLDRSGYGRHLSAAQSLKGEGNVDAGFFSPSMLTGAGLNLTSGNLAHFVSSCGEFVLAGGTVVVENRKICLGGDSKAGGMHNPGAIWTRKKLHVTKSLTVAMSMKPVNTTSSGKLAVSIALQAGSWWDIEPLVHVVSPIGLKVNDTPPVAPQNRSPPLQPPSNDPPPSDEAIANFLAFSGGAASQSDAVAFLKAGNNSVDQAISLYFDKSQRARILSDSAAAQTASIATPTAAKSNTLPTRPATISGDRGKFRRKPKGLYIDVIEQSSHDNGGKIVRTMSFVLRLSNYQGETKRVAEVSQVLKKGSCLKIAYDWDSKTLSILQYARENPIDVVTSLKIYYDIGKAIGADNNQLWVGIGSPGNANDGPQSDPSIGSESVELDSLVIDCSDTEVGNGSAPENAFDYTDSDSEDYFPKDSAAASDGESKAPDATKPSTTVKPVGNAVSPDEEVKLSSFMSVTQVHDRQLALRWLRGHKGNNDDAVMAYFTNPNNVPPVPLAPLQGVVIGETKTVTPTSAQTPLVAAQEADNKPSKENEERLKRQGETLDKILAQKMAESTDKTSTLLGMNEVWDTTIGELSFRKGALQNIEIVQGFSAKNNFNIYAYSTMWKNAGLAAERRWYLEGWWRDDRSRNRNHVMFKFDAETKNVDGLLFRGDNIIEWKGTRQENSTLFRNSCKDSTGYCGLVNGKDSLTNICFQNSLLQSLFMAPKFRVKLLSLPFQTKSLNEADQVISGLAKLYSELLAADKPHVASHNFQRALPSSSFGSGRQQDVSEFWDYLANQFSLSDPSYQIKTADGNLEGIAQNMFGCLTQTSMECKTCGSKKTGKVEPYLGLPLSFPTRFKAITHLKVVSGRGTDVRCPDGYERLGTSLNNGREDAPYIFLCIKRDPMSTEEPISDITVLHCASTAIQPTMLGWTILDGNLNVGGRSTADRVYLAYKRGDGSPITNIDILCGKETHVKEGYSKIEKDLNRGEKDPVFLCYLQDLPIRDVVLSDRGLSGYTFIDRPLNPSSEKDLFFLHTDQGNDAPITSIELVDKEALAGLRAGELKVLSADLNNKGKVLIARRGNGCPLTDIHVFRAPHSRPRHGYNEYIDLIEPSTEWPQRLNGEWLSPSTSRLERDLARRKIQFKAGRMISNAVRLQGTFSGNGGGVIEGAMVCLQDGIYQSMCTVKGVNYKVESFITVRTSDNFETIAVGGGMLLNNIPGKRSGAEPSRKGFITHVIAIEDKEKAPEGFEVVEWCVNSSLDAADLNRNTAASKKVFLAFKRDTGALPITDISVVWEFETITTGNFETVLDFEGKSCNLNEGSSSSALFLCVKRAPSVGNVSRGLVDIAVLRVGGVSSAKVPDKFEKVEKSAGNMRHTADLNVGNKEEHRLYLCKCVGEEPAQPVDHVVNGVYDTEGVFGRIELNAILVADGYLVNGKFDMNKYDQNRVEGSMRGFLLPDEKQKTSDTKHLRDGQKKSETCKKWVLVGSWKDSSHTTDQPFVLNFLNPYSTCSGSYSDGKDSYKWDFVKDDFVQIAFKHDYRCNMRNGVVDFGKRCFRHDISQMVMDFFSPTVIPGLDCETCEKRTTHTSRLHCTKSPDHLMLTVKRMSFDWRTNKNIKSLMDAHFSITVTIPRISSGSPSKSIASEDNMPRTYGLFAVIVHSGKTSNSGHYYCYARSAHAEDLHKPDSSQSPWIKFNDMRVEFVEGGFNAMRKTIRESVSANAYILLYTRLLDPKLAANSSALPGEIPVSSPKANSAEHVAIENDSDDDEEALLAMALAMSNQAASPGPGAPDADNQSPANAGVETQIDDDGSEGAPRSVGLGPLPEWYQGIEKDNNMFWANNASSTDQSWSTIMSMVANLEWSESNEKGKVHRVHNV